MNIQEKSNAINGQGSDKSGLAPRGLNRERAKDPNVKNLNGITENPALYARVISQGEIETGRIIAQVSSQRNLFSSQLNNEINPTMENKSIEGGDREVI